MIIDLRRYIKGRGFRVFLYIMLAAMAGVFSLAEVVRRYATRNNDWIVQVNGSTLPYADFTRKVRQQEQSIRMLRSQYGEYADMLFKTMGLQLNPKKLGFDSMVKEELLNQTFNFLGAHFNEQYIGKMLYNIQFIQKELADLIPFHAFDRSSQGINMQVVARHIQQMGMSMEDFHARLLQALQRYQGLQLVQLSGYIPNFELKRLFDREHRSKQFSVAVFSVDHFIKSIRAETISTEDLQAFYNAKNVAEKRYWVPELRNAVVLNFDPAHYGIAVTDTEIEKYYNEQKSRKYVETPTQVQVRRIVLHVPNRQVAKAVRERAQLLHEKLLKDPTQFAQIAKQESDDTETAINGGLLPYFSRNTYEYDFEKASFLLRNDGDISHIVTTSQGFEIVQRVGKKVKVYKPLESVKDEIVALLTQRLFNKQFSSDITRVLAQAKQDPAALQQFIAHKNATKQVVTGQAQDSTRLAQELFKHSANEISFYQEKSGGVVFKVTKINRKHLPKLVEISDAVRHDLELERAQKMMTEHLKVVQNQAFNQDFASIEQAGVATITSTDFITKDDQKLLERFQKIGITPKVLFNLEKVGSTLVHQTPQAGYIVRLDAIELFNQGRFDESQGSLQQLGYGEQSQLLELGFVASLFRNATIKVNNILMQA